MKYLSLIALIIFIVMPSVASAAPFVTCSLELGADGKIANPCNLCHLIDMGNTVLQWLIGVLLVVFSIIVAVAGFGLATSGGNPEAKSAAKSKIMNALIGLVIVLAAWLLVDTVMKALLTDGEINGTIWSTITC
jgi:hypothetical protein